MADRLFDPRQPVSRLSCVQGTPDAGWDRCASRFLTLGEHGPFDGAGHVPASRQATRSPDGRFVPRLHHALT